MDGWMGDVIRNKIQLLGYQGMEERCRFLGIDEFVRISRRRGGLCCLGW